MTDSPRRRSGSVRIAATESTNPSKGAAAPHSTREGWLPFAMTLVAGALLWAALPGNGFWIGAIAGVVPFAWLIGVPRLPGRRPYRQIFFASWAHTAVAYWFIVLAHVGAAIGWIALSFYLATLWPLVIVVARWWVHRIGVPIWLAAPIAWTGMEYVRGHLFTGFGMGLLAHSLIPVPTAIQFADVAGGYGVSFMIVLWGATIASIVGVAGTMSRGSRIAAAVSLVVSLIAVLGYGANRIAAPHGERSAMVGVVQGNIEATFPETQAAALEYWQGIGDQYRDGTRELLASVRAEGVRNLDLIVWPESKFTALDTVLDSNQGAISAAGYAEAERRAFDIEIRSLVAQGVMEEHEMESFDPSMGDRSVSVHERFRAWIETRSFEFVPMLVGIQSATIADDFETEGFTRFGNSAALIDRDRRVAARYSKNHLVLFGEYAPFGETLPWLYDLLPFEAGMVAGRSTTPIRAGELTFAPTICFESTVPHLVRRHCREAAAAGEPIDALVNLTDDSWFRGASGLDLHLACNIFRAVEMRKPMVVSANGGISAIIDGRGRVLVRTERSREARFAAVVNDETLSSPYLNLIGDWPAFSCGVAFGLSLLLAPVFALRRRKIKSPAAE